MLYVSRRERFSAAHRQFNPSLNEQENKDLFGQCSNFNYHGHNYELIVTVKGEINPISGYVIDIKHLSKLIHKAILDKVDHKNLNLDVDFLKGIKPTSENILQQFWHQLQPLVEQTGCTLHYMKLIETENNWAEFYG
jgi:6-pyruvoyltetrahydropterin/6-carboxytetrahydropterin synthase